MKVYTRRGDDGTTGLLYGGRVRKDAPAPTAYGAVDEAQAALGIVRADLDDGDELAIMVVSIMRDLWVLMAELATLPESREKLEPGRTLVTSEMVTRLEHAIDDVADRFDAPTEFIVPGGDRVAALLDVARTIVRRAERESLPALHDDSQAGIYLNRLSDLLWTLARWREGDSSTAVRDVS
ncbi:MAG TPA: cob(I)yrinic acid a,c-diamide adenosyltransferase [Acidimicrobiia bacterium]|nr:cob(I)yrinic acid a,c-diamide adenosyltransferase [Acidimicrobiia bacterium]